MPVVAVIGGQWGDEGKGRVVDLLAGQAHMVVRFCGGPNAGHTVVNQHGEVRLRLTPSGIFYPDTTCIIGNGVVVSPSILLDEMIVLRSKGISTSKLLISERAHLIMPYHLLQDKLEEEALGSQALGTTLTGVGPAYADKVGRLGIRVGDLLDEACFRERLTAVLRRKNDILTKIYGAPPLSLDNILAQYSQYGEALAPHIKETEPLVAKAVRERKFILLEGAQGSLLDVDFGTYPYVTSSSTAAGGGCTGMGISPTQIDSVLGVFKCYNTRVGGGPMPTELLDEVGAYIRDRAHEYGTTTGRPRRCGWFDAVAARFSCQVNGFTGIVLTRLDILDTLPFVKVCVGYEHNGQVVHSFPSGASALARCKPVYEELPGWQSPTGQVRRFDDLPKQAQAFVRRLEGLVECPVNMVCVGPRREEAIMIRPIL